MLRALSVNLMGFIGSNQVLNACGWMLSLIKAKQLSHTELAVTLIEVFPCFLLVSYNTYDAASAGISDAIGCDKYVNKSLNKKIILTFNVWFFFRMLPEC